MDGGERDVPTDLHVAVAPTFVSVAQVPVAQPPLANGRAIHAQRGMHHGRHGPQDVRRDAVAGKGFTIDEAAVRDDRSECAPMGQGRIAADFFGHGLPTLVIAAIGLWRFHNTNVPGECSFVQGGLPPD